MNTRVPDPSSILIGIHATTDTPGKAEAEGFLNRTQPARVQDHVPRCLRGLGTRRRRPVTTGLSVEKGMAGREGWNHPGGVDQTRQLGK